MFRFRGFLRPHALGVAGAAWLLATGTVAAQVDDPATTTTSAPETTTTTSPSTSTTVPATGAGGADPAAEPPVRPEDLVPFVDPISLGEAPPSDDTLGGGSGQAPFDPASRAVLTRELRSARAELRELEEVRDTLVDDLARLSARSDGLRAIADELGDSADVALEDAAAARREMKQRVSQAFTQGDRRLSLLAVIDDPVSYNRGSTYLAALADQGRISAERAAELGASLSEEEDEIVEELVDTGSLVEVIERRLQDAIEAVADAEGVVAAYEAGAHVGVSGFVFPVAGPAHFIDSWGFPRMPGTPNAHWHEGTDIMAPYGRELLAVEDGVVDRIGSNGLGGQRLWLTGVSGTEYYYAHLSGFAPGLVDGDEVSAGDLVGFVGDSGNARGGVPHLHFQVHPGGGDPVNPYPLLIAARRDTEIPTQSAALAGPRTVLTAADPGS